MSPPQPTGPAVALLDIAHVPTALLALDALLKEAPVQLLSSGSVQPGRWLLLFSGAVEPCHMAFDKAVDAAADQLVDSVFLPYAHPQIVPALLSANSHAPRSGDTLLVLQTASGPPLLRALDASLKGAEVSLMQLRVASGLGGAAFATLWGTAHDAEAAQTLAQAVAPQLSSQLIRNADPELRRSLASGSHFFGA